MNQSSNRLVYVFTLCLYAVVVPSQSAAIDLEAIDTGFITATGGSSKFDGVLSPDAEYNYSVGWELHYDGGGLKPTIPFVYQEKKNFFVFDLGSITPGSVVSADIILPLPAGGYTSTDPADCPNGADSAGRRRPWLDHGGNGFFRCANGSRRYDGSGAWRGLVSLEVGDAGTDVVITLTAAGIDYLNGGAGGTIVIGGKVESIEPMPFTQELFSGTAPFPLPGIPPFTPTDLPTLSRVTIPIPASLSLLFSAIASIIVWRRRYANA